MKQDAGEARSKLINAMREIAKDLGSDTVPRNEFRRRTSASERKIQILFGSYNALVEAAGLRARQFPTSDSPTYSDQGLITEVIRVLRLPNAKLSRVFFEQHGKVSTSTCERHFGGWINVIRTARANLDGVADAELIARIDEYAPAVHSARTHSRENADENIPEETGGTAPPEAGHAFIEGKTANVYGDFINFRGLQHEPVNEQGVVFLFGMVCREIGYVVEIVRSGFPDCEAKRRIRGKAGLWQRVRIEFEFESRNFRNHGHDPDQCDLIVCWVDNWKECPIEVLDLRSAIRKLSAAVKSTTPNKDENA
jgi:hypothetical protein